MRLPGGREAGSRRSVIVSLAWGLLAWPLSAAAQRPGKPRRIGFLRTSASYDEREVAIKRRLRELGYVEGRDVAFEERSVKGELRRYPELAAELVRLEPDVLLTTNTLGARALANATRTIPIVVIGSGELVETGLAVSLARPGGNVTGLTSLSSDLSKKRLEVLREIIPDLKRVAVLWNPEAPVPKVAFQETRAAAAQFNLEIESLEVRSASDIERVLSATQVSGVPGFLLIYDPLTASNVRRIAELVTKRRLPSIYPAKAFVDAGGLIAYGPHYLHMYRRGAEYVDRILKGAVPAEMPIEQPSQFEMHVNAKTAKILQIRIPASVLARADSVLQ